MAIRGSGDVKSARRLFRRHMDRFSARTRGPRRRHGPILRLPRTSPPPPLSQPHLLASFGHAANGLIDSLARGRNMKVEVVCGILVALVGSGVALGLLERLALLACVGVVLAAEAFNTALEEAVDLAINVRHEGARLAKDAAAGAVLALSVTSVGILVLVLAANWEAIAPQGPRIARQVAVGVPFALGAGLLAARFPRPRWVDHALTVSGVLLWLALASWTTSVSFTAVAALLFALCALAASRRISP